MLVDSNTLTDVKVDGNFLMGKAAGDSALLKDGELVFMAVGVREFISRVAHNFPRVGRGTASNGGYDDGFHVFKDFADALDIFINKPHTLVKYNPTELQPTDWTEQGAELEYDVVGDFIDIGRVLEGVPESYGSLHNGVARTRRVRILIDNGNSGSMDARTIAHRSERIIRLIDALENSNVRVELVAVDSGGCAHSECVIKQFHESLSLEDVAVGTHPEFLRRICFRIIEHSDTYQSGYGKSTWLILRQKHLVSEVNDELAIYVEGNIHHVDLVFDRLEKQLLEELSQPVPTLGMMSVGNDGVQATKL